LSEGVVGDQFNRCETASFRVTPRDKQSAGPQFER
jgi:hypothetical protein